MNPEPTRKGAASEKTVQDHYGRLADRYDDFLYYSADFMRALTSRMIEKLQLQPGDRFVDLGGGTGIYSLDILEQVPLDNPVICVDPIPEMLARIPKDAPIQAVPMDALGFSAREGTYDKVLMKEAVHHVDDKAALFAHLYERLTPGGRLLLVHVPPRLEYPLFARALRRAERWHADPDELARLLAAAGFGVDRDAVDYRHTIPRETYFRMVENRYMSVLSSFSEEEIREGLAEMAQRYGGQETLTFVDHFDYVTGIKPSA